MEQFQKAVNIYHQVRCFFKCNLVQGNHMRERINQTWGSDSRKLKTCGAKKTKSVSLLQKGKGKGKEVMIRLKISIG